MRLALLALLGVGSAFALLSPFPAPRSLLAPANAEPKDRAKDRERWPLQRFLRTVRFFNAQSAPGWAVSLLDRAIGGSAPAPPTADSAARPLLVVIGAHMDQAAAQLVSALRSSARNAVLLADPLAPPQDLPNASAYLLLDSALRSPAAKEAVAALLKPVLRRAAQNLTLFSAQEAGGWAMWGELDDVVMGGVSSSEVVAADGRAFFRGAVSTSNNGGFASVRTLNNPMDLSAYSGIRLRVRGAMDRAARFKLILRDEEAWDGIAWCNSFDVPASSAFDGAPLEILIPFESFRPVRRSSSIQDGRTIRRSFINSLQLMHSKFEYDGALNPLFQAGDFALEIVDMSAYCYEVLPPKLVVLASGHFDTSVMESLQHEVFGGCKVSLMRYGNSTVEELKTSLSRVARLFI